MKVLYIYVSLSVCIFLCLEPLGDVFLKFPAFMRGMRAHRMTVVLLLFREFDI